MNVVVTFEQDHSTPKDLNITKKLGHGKFEVFHAQDTATREEYAVKIFPKNDFSQFRFRREKEFLTSLDHPNIIKYHPIADQDGESDLLIMDYAPNGDFFDLVTKGGLAHEVHMRTYFHQMIAGLEYLHSQGIAHLDLKLENLLMGKDFLLKIIDFDQSQSTSDKRLVSGGTNSYRAPEVRERTCSDMIAADVYSAGIILFAFKTWQFPFVEIEQGGETKMIYYDLFMDDNEEFWKMKAEKMGKQSDFFGEDFKKLLAGMLEKDPNRRMTIQEIKASEWYNKPVLSQEGLKFHMNRVYQRMNQK